MSERTVQEVFNLAISEGFYGVNETLSSSYYMCSSLETMHRRSLLSDSEYLEAMIQVEEYLSYLCGKVQKPYDCVLLSHVLKKLGVLSKDLSKQETFDFLVSIYSDWDNRPLI